MDDATILMIREIGWEKFERIRQGKDPLPRYDVKVKVYSVGLRYWIMTRRGHILIPSKLNAHLKLQMPQLQLMNGRGVHDLGKISWIVALLQTTPNAIYKKHHMFVRTADHKAYEVPITDVRIYNKAFLVHVKSERITVSKAIVVDGVGLINPHGSYCLNEITPRHLHPTEETEFDFSVHIIC
jgi:hypothetical protein